MAAYKREMRERRKREGIPYARHHRKPRSLGGLDTPENLSIVPRHLHVCWHALFANHSPEVIALIISERWLDPAYEMVAKKKDPP